MRRTAITFGLVLAVGAVTACSAGEPDGGSSAAPVVPESLFDSAAVHDIDLALEPADIDALISAYLSGESAVGDSEWAHASVTIDGTRLEDVGVAVAASADVPRASDIDVTGLPLAIRFDAFVDDQEIDGETGLVLSANPSPTGVNEAVTLELLSVAGLATESAVSTSFTVNGGAPRLRLAVQELTEPWIADQFDAGDTLYVAERGGSYDYRGSKASAYAGSFTRVAGDGDLDPVISLLKFTDRSTDAEFAAGLNSYLDIDSFASYLAFEKIVNDGAIASRTALEYGETTKVLTLVPWDYSAAFTDAGDTGGPVPEELTARFLATPDFAEVYEQSVSDLSALYFDAGNAQSFLDDRTKVLVAQASDVVSTSDIRRASRELEQRFLDLTP